MSRYWNREYSELFEQEGWRGYEFWSAQVEAEMDLVKEEEPSAARMHTLPQAKTPQKGAGDVLPF